MPPEAPTELMVDQPTMAAGTQANPPRRTHMGIGTTMEEMDGPTRTPTEVAVAVEMMEALIPTVMIQMVTGLLGLAR